MKISTYQRHKATGKGNETQIVMAIYLTFAPLGNEEQPYEVQHFRNGELETTKHSSRAEAIANYRARVKADLKCFPE